MLRSDVTRRAGRRSWGGREPVCLGCVQQLKRRSDDERVDAFYDERLVGEVEPAPCAGCGLPVIVEPDKRRKVTTCSDRCRSRYYTEQRRAVTDRPTHPCQGCGETMTGRADRRYCSPACRQRAYRRRAHLVRAGISAADAEHVDTFAGLTAEQFEDVLRQARQDDDLSAEHVGRLAQDVLRQA